MVVCRWILCLGLFLPYAISDDVLKFVHIIYRHGDRTPLRVFPTDVHNGPSTWYQGFGELIPAGMRRHYQLGLWFRQRYATFLNDTFEQTQIKVRSTDYNRTIMSAMCNLAGLYPPKGEQHWNTAINWQPIPVRVVDKKNDKVLRHRSCPKVDELQREVEKSAKWMQLEQKYAPFLRFLSEKTGYTKIQSRLERITKIYDPISKEYKTRKDRMMPWINDSIVQQVSDLYDLRVRYYKYEHDTIKRLRGGPVLEDIVERMERRLSMGVDHKKYRRKIYFYSAHDSTVLALLKAMNIEVHRQIPYACAVMVELYQSSNTGQWTVRTFMKNDTGENDMGDVRPHELQVGGCPPASPCPLNQFIKRSRPFIPKDWSAECKTSIPIESTAAHTDVLTITKTTGNQTPSPQILMFVLVGVLIGVGIMLLLFTLFSISFCLYNKKRSARKQLENESTLGTAERYVVLHGADEMKSGPTDDKRFGNESSVTSMNKSAQDKPYSTQADVSGLTSPNADTSSESS